MAKAAAGQIVMHLWSTLDEVLGDTCGVTGVRIKSTQDWMMFCTYFAIALAMGHLAARLRAQQDAERRREQYATAMYLLTRELAQATDFADLLAVIIREVGRVAQADVALSLPEEAQDGSLTPYFASTWLLSEKEQSVALWAFRRRQPAGRGTDTLPSAEGVHLPLLAGERAVGVLSVRFRDGGSFAANQRDLLEAFVRQIALVGCLGNNDTDRVPDRPEIVSSSIAQNGHASAHFIQLTHLAVSIRIPNKLARSTRD